MPLAQFRNPLTRASFWPICERASRRSLSLLDSAAPDEAESGRDLRLPAPGARARGLPAGAERPASGRPCDDHREAVLRMASRVPKIRSGSGGPSPVSGSGGASRPPSAADEPTAIWRAGLGSMAEATEAVGEESDLAVATALVRARAVAAGPAGGWMVETRVAGRGGGPMPPVGAAGAGGAPRSRLSSESSPAPAGPGPAARGVLPAAIGRPFGCLRGAKARAPLAGRAALG